MQLEGMHHLQLECDDSVVCIRPCLICNLLLSCWELLLCGSNLSLRHYKVLRAAAGNVESFYDGSGQLHGHGSEYLWHGDNIVGLEVKH
jgi:hypothetical protein